MNSRALVLVLAVLAVAGTLVYLFSAEAPAPASSGALTTDGSRPAPRAETPAVAPRVSTPLRVAAEGAPGPWTILVAGPKGEVLPAARVVARQAGRAHEGLGNTTFYSLDAGEWSLEVEAEGYPKYTETVTLEPGGSSTRTMVRFDNKIRLTGILLDQRGEPLDRSPVWLLAEGTDHPSEPAKTAGAVRQQTGLDGRFRFQAGDSGTYRLSVGPPGPEPRFVSEEFDLVVGRERVARVTVPARATLRVRAEGAGAEGPTVVQILRRSEVAASPNGPGDAASLTDPSSAEDVQRIIRQKRAEAEARGDSSKFSAGDEGDEGDEGSDKGAGGELTPQMLAQREEAQRRAQEAVERRARLQEPGWTNLRSVRFEEGEEGVVSEVPEETALRFVVYRGAEGLKVADQLTAPPGALVRLTINPPMPFPPGTDLPVEPRVSASRLEVERLPRDAPEVGVVFEGE